MTTPLDLTDYYGLCQSGVMTLLRSLSYFSSKPMVQVSTNLNNVNKGFAHWAIFKPSTFTSSRLDPHNKRYVWRMLFDLYVRYKTADEVIPKFQEVRSAIVNLLDTRSSVSGIRGVEEISIAAQSEFLQDVPGDNPNFVIQTFAVSVAQRVTRKF